MGDENVLLLIIQLVSILCLHEIESKEGVAKTVSLKIGELLFESVTVTAVVSVNVWALLTVLSDKKMSMKKRVRFNCKNYAANVLK